MAESSESTDMSSATPNEAVAEDARRQHQVLIRLQNALKDKRLVIIVGAGVTLSATAEISEKPLQRTTWTGLIRNGLDYMVNCGYLSASNKRIRRAYDALEDDDPVSLLDAANIMKDELAQLGEYPTWLDMVLGDLYQEVRHPAIFEVLKALHKEGAILLTTNYDDLLETSCRLDRIGRSNMDDILKFKRGELDGVFHVHGSYHDPQEVVLDTTDYYRVANSDEVQNVLKTFLEYKTILFIGCGSGLEDPNFSGLLKWAGERYSNVSNRHCLLVRNGDSLNHKTLVRLKYGPNYKDLAPYLNRLLNDTSPARSADETAHLQRFPSAANKDSGPFTKAPSDSLELGNTAGKSMRKMTNEVTTEGWAPVNLFTKLLKSQLSESPALRQFFEAAKSGNSQGVKRFIDNSHIHPNVSNSEGMTAIAYAAHYGRTEVVVNLLLDQYQADPSIPDTAWQQTPLFRAAKGGHVAIVERLLTCDGVGVNTPDKDGQTALAVAAAHGWVDVVKVLLAYKNVDITYVDCDGRSALSRAKSEQIKGLLKAALEGDEYIFV